MNRIASRSWIVIVLTAILVLGLLFFSGEYLVKAKNWVRFSGSPHLYSGNDLKQGTVVDRDGVMLLDFDENRTYAPEPATRKATLHWIGDRTGNIQPPLLKEYSLALCGYEMLNGVYTYSEQKGKLQLTLSATVQEAALKAMGSRKGVVAVMNYRTGELLCALSTPTFDPEQEPDIAGDTTGMYDGVYLNRFTQSSYIPGSVFKIVTTAAALESVPGILERTFICRGSMQMEGSKVVCTGVHGTQTLKQAFANSCNCAFAQITELVGRDRMNRFVERFGVTKPLLFDGLTTSSGNFDRDSTDRLSLCWSGIGQHKDLINPCRYLSFVAAIANGGRGMHPYVVESVRFGSDTTYRARPAASGRILSRDAAQTLRELMRNNVVIQYGAEHFPDLKVCAKSGTAEMGVGDNNALFTGFVDDPKYPLAFFVVVEQGGFGSTACVPIVSQVLEACVSVMDGQ